MSIFPEKPKVVLAYSGGLDTSCLIKWLQEHGYRVIAMIADVGQNEDFDAIERRALATGAEKVYILDLKNEFVHDFIFPSLRAGAVYEDRYLLATALSRPLIAKHQVHIAHKEHAQAVAHGCTGKGNDQVRFEVTYRLMDPSLTVLAPVRIWEFKTREKEIEYAKQHKIPVNVTKKSPYSIDTNLYGRSIECGVLEDPWVKPPEEIYALTKDPRSAPDKPQDIVITFEQGRPVRLNGKEYDPVTLIRRLNTIGGRHGVGRIDMVENRLVGIKSREIYECPGGWILHTALRDLETLTLDRETWHEKQEIGRRYGRLVYNGLWETPQRRHWDAYVNMVMRRVSGDVRVELFKGRATVTGRRSPYSRYRQEMATYGEADIFDQSMAEGFIRLWTFPFEDHSGFDRAPQPVHERPREEGSDIVIDVTPRVKDGQTGKRTSSKTRRRP